jgi:ankyrin repeat protein
MNVSATDRIGRTAVLHAVLQQNSLSTSHFASRLDSDTRSTSTSDLVERLLQHGADIETGSYQYASPFLAIMLRDKYINTARLLLDHGENVNAQGPDKNLDTPLYAAALHNRFDAAKLLLQNGAQRGLAALDALRYHTG